MASSSSSAVCSPSNYDVFLSFRGETRDNFTSHLFAALSRKKINTFMDEAINIGDKISVEILNAKIEGSRIAVIIFSKDYASSKWCLDELNKILECKKKNGQIVIPVFYHVHPSDVRKQIGSFEKAFVEHEKLYKEMPDKVQKWRNSLAEATYLRGHESTKIRCEADLVDVIVKDVLKKLEDITVSTDFDGLIGINSRIEQVKSLLCIGLSDFRIVGIWGMGGIGKTTLAQAIFKQVSRDFDGKCFMANVREKTNIGGGLEQLQKEVLSHLLEANIEKGGPSIPHYTKERLQRMKVFIVLDDVNKFGQLEYLVRELGPFGGGSRIIITTRDKQVLDKYRVNLLYNVEGLIYHEALEHFCNYAFIENHCPEDLMELSERAVYRAKGNPLVLKILGSFLRPKSKREWENALDNLKLSSDPDISDVLQMSYQELSTEVQHIFLDIACFFKGDDKDFVISIFDGSYSIHSGLDILVDKSLITISCNKLEMHDLLQEMGQEIVCEESEEPEQRSRLWYQEDILDVLKNKRGTNSIKGIFLDMSQIKDINLDLDSTAFVNMSNLRLLKFYMPEQYGDMRSKVGLSQGLEYLSDKLRYLHWHGYPWKTLPKNFTVHNLIQLSLPYSNVEQLWEGKKKAFKLKFIDLHHSQDFITIPDPSEAPNLERLNLSYCVKLSRIPPSIKNFNKLGILCLKGCKRITCFPRNIHFGSPITIDLSCCEEFTEFPQISGKILELNLSGTAIEEVLPSIERLTDLEKLDLSFCDELKAVSPSICKLKSLCVLSLDYCTMLEGFPDILEKMECLECIGLKFTAIKELPPSIENLQGLRILSLMDCSKLDSLPENLGNLKSLKVIRGKRLSISQLPSSITDLMQLEQLSLSGCKGLVLPSLSGLCSLKTLELDDCGIMKIPQDIGYLSSLESLKLKGNNFESLPSSMEKLSKLRELILRNCNNLESLPMLPQHPFRLEATNCKQLKCLPMLPVHLPEVDASVLEKLSNQYACNKAAIAMELDFSNCPNLNGNTADLQLRIHHMAFASLSQFCEDEITVPHGVSICLPGTEIPDWFSNRISGSSINIQQPQPYCDGKFIGFALCAVVAIERGFQADEDFVLICKYRFNTNTFPKTKHVERQFVFKTIKNYLFDDGLINYRTHIYLGFDPCLNVGLSDAISFDFFVDAYKIEKRPKVKHCGVCAIQARCIDTKPNTSILESLFGVVRAKSATTQLTSSTPDIYNLQTHQLFVSRGLILTTLVAFSHLKELKLDDCGIVEIPPDIGCLSSLQELNLMENKFETLPTSIKQLSNLRRLILSRCNMLQSLPELPPCLFHLEARNCMQLQSLPKLPSCPEELDFSVLTESINQCHIGFTWFFDNSSWIFDFSNCMKLDENSNNIILADSQLRIQHLAFAFLRLFYGEKEIRIPGVVSIFLPGRQIPDWFSHQSSGPGVVSIFLPGRQIPDWFSHQSSGNSISIPEPHLYCDRKLIGFALCAVIDVTKPFKHHWTECFLVSYVFRSETEDFYGYIDCNEVKGQDDLPICKSKHMYLGFRPFLFGGNRYTGASFFFNFITPDKNKAVVECCGVCPLYAHPTNSEPNTFTVSMVPPSEEEFKKMQEIA